MKHALKFFGVVAAVAFMAVWISTLLPSEVQAQGSGLNFTCALDDIGATLTKMTRCDDADLPAQPGMRRYITDIVAQSTTTTSGLWILRYGTGTNCATGTTSLLPSAATVARLAAPANTIVPTVMHFNTPLIVPSGQDLCLLGVATNTTTMEVSGYVAP